MTIPPIFLTKNHLPLPKGGKIQALFGKESCQRSWLRDWKTFCLHTIFGYRFGCKFACKLGCRIKANPSGFSPRKTTSLYMSCPVGTRAAILRFFGVYLSVAEIWCEQVANVQTCGLHRRSMNAPTMLIYKYIYLWPTKINHGYTVGATIGRLISNYLNWFSSINQQPKLIAKSALFGKESCQRSWLRDWIISARSQAPSWLTAKLYIYP